MVHHAGVGQVQGVCQSSVTGTCVTMRLLFLGLALAVAIYLISGGHILFLPLLLFFPLGLFGHRRYGRLKDGSRR
jgi:hypothetical protein